MAREKMSLQEQANKILEQAQEKGVQSNFFFVTTFKRYQVQMATLAQLEEAIKEHGPTVEKEYVKGRQNLVVNPAITEYNKTSTAANGTVSTLINIIKTLSNEPDAVDALSEFLNG
jgi:predicted secreted Zn-dependent protease